MSLEDGQKIYTLTRPVSYSHKGETREAKFLELREPGGSHRRSFLKLKQMVRLAVLSMGSKLMEFSDLAEKNKGGPVAGEEVKRLHEVDQDEYEKEAQDLADTLGMAFGSSREVGLADFVDTFGELACQNRFSSICVIDGETPMTSAIWEQLSPDDAEGVAFTYASFFIMPSAFPKGKD